MGEYVTIKIGNYDFIASKNTFGDLLSIFSPEELILEDDCFEDGEKFTRRYFKKSVAQAKLCLDIMGHTINKARDLFEHNKESYLEYLLEDADEKEIQNITKEYTFDSWEKAVMKYSSVLAKDVFDNGVFRLLEKEVPTTVAERMVYDSLPFFKDYTYFGIDFNYSDEGTGNIWDVFRVILEAFDDEELLILDYTYLYEGGWCGEYPDEDSYKVPKTVILTEGSTDAFIISTALKLLYPSVTKYYSFIDFSAYEVQGSTNYLTHYLKAFIAAGIENRILALYDNDSAGLAEIKNLQKIPFPDNVRIMHLPNLDFCNEYPTIGPSGKNVENINGRACSIELFLGKDILLSKGVFYPIRWKSYIDKVEAYQGEIIAKSEVLKMFDEKRKKAEIEGINSEDWTELGILLRKIFASFIE